MLRTDRWRLGRVCSALAALLVLGVPGSAGSAAGARAGGLTLAARQVGAAPRPRPPPAARERVTFTNRDDGTVAYVYPPKRAERASITMMLHGMCGHPAPSCDFWADTVPGWLLCPTGNTRCGTGWDWRGDGLDKAGHLTAARQALRSSWPDYVAPNADVIVGFSRGAFAARDILYAVGDRPDAGPTTKPRFVGAVFIGAAFVPDAERLERAGVRRVVFASGVHDGARPTMLKATAAMILRGIPARFVSLGPIWHQLPADLGERLVEPLAWVRRSR